MKVVLREDETLDDLVRRFKQGVKKEKILEACRKHEFFVSKSIKRKEKSKEHAKEIKSSTPKKQASVSRRNITLK